MTETDPFTRLSIGEQNDGEKSRYEKLQPALARLALQAKDTYSALRPLAKPSSKVERNYPLRYQQVHGMSSGGEYRAEVADYLMIAFGNHHDLVLYRNYPDQWSYEWQFNRSLLVSDLTSQKTKIEEWPAPYGIEIEAATFLYPKEIGHNAQSNYNLCDYSNDYADAEIYISEMEDDLNQALKSFAK